MKVQGYGGSLANGEACGDVNNAVPVRVHVLEKLLGGLFSNQEKS